MSSRGNSRIAVVGGGISGLQAALEITEAGNEVYLVERQSTIGGMMARFDKTFPTLDCAACILTPKMVGANRRSNLRLMTMSEVESVDGFSGHSDRGQLMNWIANLSPRPERIIIGHGEPSKSVDLASSIHKKYGIETRVPQNLETIRLC